MPMAALLLRDLVMPDFREYAVAVHKPGTGGHGINQSWIVFIWPGTWWTAFRDWRESGHFQQCLGNQLVEHGQYIYEHGDDLPEVKNWTWPY